MFKDFLLVFSKKLLYGCILLHFYHRFLHLIQNKREKVLDIINIRHVYSVVLYNDGGTFPENTTKVFAFDVVFCVRN